jgi:hypothetical protein
MWPVVGGLAVFGVLGVVVLARRSHDHGSLAASSSLAPRLRASDLVVEAHPVRLPEAYITIRDWSVPRPWVLLGYDRPAAEALVRDVAGAAEALQCTRRGCSVTPTAAALTALSPASRNRIYNALATIPGTPQAEDAFHRPAALGPFSALPGLPPGAAPWMDQLTWSQAGTPTFSDLGATCSHLPARADCDAFVRTMLSRPSSALGLRVGTPGAIARAAAEFRPEQREAVLATLGAAAAAGASSVPLTELFPTWARQRLDTFPTPAEDWTNCYWTALRFAGVDAGVIGNGATMDGVLSESFARVSGPPYFGDVLVLRDAQGGAIHAATVLVAGYVFTKNGSGHLQAWRVVPTTEVQADFPMTATTEYWRPLAPAAPPPR